MMRIYTIQRFNCNAALRRILNWERIHKLLRWVKRKTPGNCNGISDEMNGIERRSTDEDGN